MRKYAYIRVSTKEQNVDRQILALEPYHILEKNIYCDYQSGKDFERPEYQKLLRKLKEGDLLIVKSIDRLGHNYNDILSHGVGYGTSGYKTKNRKSHRYADCRSGTADFCLRSPDGTGIYLPATGRRNCSSQAKREKTRQT